MVQASWPNSGHNSRAVTEAEYEQLVYPTEASGVIGAPNQTSLIYADSSGRQVKLRANKAANVRGFHWESGTTDTTFALGANAGATRYDLIVLRLTRSTWQVAVAVVAGVSGSPAPAPTQDLGGVGVYEIPLAIATVPNGATTTTAGQVQVLDTYLAAPSMGARDSAGQLLIPRMRGRIAYRDSDGVLVWDDGTNYRTLSEDTGWLLLPEDQVAAGWATAGGAAATVYYRRFNGVTWVQVRAVRTGGQLVRSSSHLLATLPANFRPNPGHPSYDCTIAHTDGTGARDGRAASLTIGGDGSMRIQVAGTIYTNDAMYGTVNFISL